MGEGVEEVLGGLGPGALGGLFEGFGEGDAGAEAEEEELFDGEAGFGIEAGAAEADGVEAGELILAVCDAVGWDVLADGGVSLDHGEVADADELVEARAAAEEGAVADVDVTGEEDVVGEDVVVA